MTLRRQVPSLVISSIITPWPARLDVSMSIQLRQHSVLTGWVLNEWRTGDATSCENVSARVHDYALAWSRLATMNQNAAQE